MAYSFNNDELAQLFADASSAVSKAKTTPPPEPKAVPSAQTAPSPISAKVEKPAAAQQPAAAPAADPLQIAGGKLEESGLMLTLKDGSTAQMTFMSVRNLSAGRVGAEQIIAWKSGGRIYFAVYKAINLKGMIPKMEFSVSDNWKSFIGMMASKTSPSKDQGIAIAQKAVGVLPAYETREAFFEHVAL